MSSSYCQKLIFIEKILIVVNTAVVENCVSYKKPRKYLKKMIEVIIILRLCFLWFFLVIQNGYRNLKWRKIYLFHLNYIYYNILEMIFIIYYNIYCNVFWCVNFFIKYSKNLFAVYCNIWILPLNIFFIISLLYLNTI